MSYENFHAALEEAMGKHGKELHKRKSFLLGRVKFGSEAELVIASSKKPSVSRKILANELAKDVRAILKQKDYAAEKNEYEKLLKRLLKPVAFVCGDVDWASGKKLVVTSAKVWDRAWFSGQTLKENKKALLLPLLKPAKGVNSKNDFVIELQEEAEGPARLQGESDDAYERRVEEEANRAEAQAQQEVESTEAAETSGTLSDSETLERFLFEYGALIDPEVLTQENAKLIATFLRGTPSDSQKAQVAEAIQRIEELVDQDEPDTTALTTAISDLASRMGGGADQTLRSGANKVALGLLEAHVRTQLAEIEAVVEKQKQFLTSNSEQVIAEQASHYLPEINKYLDAVERITSQLKDVQS